MCFLFCNFLKTRAEFCQELQALDASRRSTSLSMHIFNSESVTSPIICEPRPEKTSRRPSRPRIAEINIALCMKFQAGKETSPYNAPQADSEKMAERCESSQVIFIYILGQNIVMKITTSKEPKKRIWIFFRIPRNHTHSINSER